MDLITDREIFAHESVENHIYIYKSEQNVLDHRKHNHVTCINLS